jgi:hypothetical protein
MARVSTDYGGDRVGLFTMDPGTTTGITWSSPVLKGSVKEIFDRDTLTVDEVDCHDEREGAKVIAETFKEQMFHWQTELQIPTSHIFFVYEDFVLYPNKKHSPEREGLSPVRITSLVEGMLVMEPINWVPQMAHLAKQRFTNDRLRRADLWTVGLEHGRDATRHAGLWVARNAAS